MTTSPQPPKTNDLLPFDPPDELRHSRTLHAVRVILQGNWWDLNIRTEQFGGRSVEFDAATGERLHVVADGESWVEISAGDARLLSDIDAEVVRQPLGRPTGPLRDYYVTVAAFINAQHKLENLIADHDSFE